MGRTISIHDLAQAKLRSSFGVLFDDVRDTFYWWHSVQFAYNWCLALLVAFNPAPDMKLFFMAVLLALSFFSFGVLVLPTHRNCKACSPCELDNLRYLTSPTSPSFTFGVHLLSVVHLHARACACVRVRMCECVCVCV
jgi:hypothetical protein